METFKTFTNRMLDATVRVTTGADDGKLWIIARDIFNYIGLKNPYFAIKKLRDCDKTKIAARDLNINRPWHLTLISEQGMYAVLMRSRKPKAQAFREWVADEVLPALRKECLTTITEPVQEVEDSEVLLDPDLLIKLATELKQRRAAEKELLEKAFVAKSRATRLEHLAGLGGGHSNHAWYRVPSIPWLDDYFKLSDQMYKAVDELLGTLSANMDIEVANVPVNDSKTTKVFHKRSIWLLKKMLDDDPKLLKRFRK